MRGSSLPTLALLLALIAGTGDVRAASTGAFLQACTITVPERPPLFAAGSAAKPADAAETSDEDDDDDEDEDEDDEDAVRGFVSPGTGTCLAVSGTVTAGLQRDSYRISPLLKATGLAPTDVTTFPVTASFRIETARTLANGLYLASAFELSMSRPADGENDDPTIAEASVTLGAWQFGMAGSRFDFWTGDDFIFSTRVPSRTVGLIGYDGALTPELSLSLSLEDTQLDTSHTLPAATGRRVPDGILRVLYERGGLAVHLAGALREVAIPGSATRLGRAGILGASWQGELLGRPGSLTAQIAGAVDAAVYAGSQLDLRVSRLVLGGDRSTRAWSGILALGRDWTDSIATNAYLSRYHLTMPVPGDRSWHVRIDRVAANLVWTPVKGFKTGLEGSLALQQVALGGRTVAGALSGRQASLQLFVERTF